jgi:hypothetical protein
MSGCASGVMHCLGSLVEILFCLMGWSFFACLVMIESHVVGWRLDFLARWGSHDGRVFVER